MIPFEGRQNVLNTGLEDNKFVELTTEVDGHGRDILAEALKARSYFTLTTTTTGANIPDEFTWSIGFVLHRDADKVWVVLFQYAGTKIAINNHNNGKWSGWRVI